MQLSEKYTDQFQGLLNEIKNYFTLQKEYVALDAAEKLTTILSAIAVAAICIVLGGIALLFCLLAMAFYIGQLTGSMAIGLLAMFVILLLLIAVFYSHRQTWVVKPIATLMMRVLAEDGTKTGADKVLLERDIHDSRERINNQFQGIVSPARQTAEKAQSASHFVSRGLAIYQGVRIGINLVRGFRNLFGKRGRRR